jgi:hypothetical protein
VSVSQQRVELRQVAASIQAAVDDYLSAGAPQRSWHTPTVQELLLRLYADMAAVGGGLVVSPRAGTEPWPVAQHHCYSMVGQEVEMMLNLLDCRR